LANEGTGGVIAQEAIAIVDADQLKALLFEVLKDELLHHEVTGQSVNTFNDDGLDASDRRGTGCPSVPAASVPIDQL